MSRPDRRRVPPPRRSRGLGSHLRARRVSPHEALSAVAVAVGLGVVVPVVFLVGFFAFGGTLVVVDRYGESWPSWLAATVAFWAAVGGLWLTDRRRRTEP